MAKVSSFNWKVELGSTLLSGTPVYTEITGITDLNYDNTDQTEDNFTFDNLGHGTRDTVGMHTRVSLTVKYDTADTSHTDLITMTQDVTDRDRATKVTLPDGTVATVDANYSNFVWTGAENSKTEFTIDLAFKGKPTIA